MSKYRLTEPSCLQILGNVGVLVQAKHFGVLGGGQLSNELDIVLVLALGRHDVYARHRESMSILLGHLGRVKVGQNGHETASVPIVGDATAVVALARHVEERVVRHLVVLVEEHEQLTNRDAQIGLVEAVRDVEPKRTELSSLLHERVEKAQPEE